MKHVLIPLCPSCINRRCATQIPLMLYLVIVLSLLVMGMGCASSQSAREKGATKTSTGREEAEHRWTVQDYTTLQAATIRFYGAQRCGSAEKNPNWLLHDPHFQDPQCHLEDQYQQVVDSSQGKINVDLTGGWHDAGDFLKFTRTIAWSSYLLLKGFDAFPEQYGDLEDGFEMRPNGVPDLLDQVRPPPCDCFGG